MKKLILTLSILLITIISYGQHQTISVNGIELDKHYTQSQIYNILGTPKSIKPNEFDAWYSRYYYNNSSFAFGHEDWDLLAFTIKDTTYKVNNYLTVGMHSDSIKAMKGYLTPEKNADEDSSFLYWAPSKEYRDNVAYIQIWVNRKTRKIEMIGLLTVKFHDYY
jgi:hypothetical protein